MKRLTTRGPATAEAIRDAIPFTTSGALYAEVNTSTYIYSGHLNGVEAEILRTDGLDGINYVVWSYSTPIAWRRTDGRWRVVAQRFSITTSKHQGNLYLIPREVHDTEVTPIGGPNTPVKRGHPRWRAECATCGTVLRLFTLKPDAETFAHGHRFNHDHPIYAAG